MYERSQVRIIAERMAEQDPLMQIVCGPRQTGKSTMIAQALAHCDLPAHSVSADDVISADVEWIRSEWQQARNLSRLQGGPCILVLDEVQKVEGWPNAVKGLWDADKREGRELRVVLSGSSSLLLRKGAEDSLQGRYELIRSPHWSLSEMSGAFGYSLDDFLFLGGYPGAARFRGDEGRWLRYMRDSIIEPTIAKDVLSLSTVRKPALMRALFEIGATFSAQELSYNKMLGQLTDAGNTTTLAAYLDLLGKANVLCGLEKHHPKALTSRKSSPRLMVYDTSLMTAASGRSRELVLSDRELRGHLVESAVGAYLLARSLEEGFEVRWWRDGNDEVDFVLAGHGGLAAVEVKSGRTKSQGGMREFLARYPETLRIVVGGSATGSVDLEDFLAGKVQLGV